MTPPSRTLQETPAPAPGPLAKFSPSEQTIRAQIQLETLLESAAKKAAATVGHLSGKQVLEDFVVPLVGMQKVWTHMLAGDIMRFSTQTLVNAIPDAMPEADVMIGVPPDDVEAWLDVLASTVETLTKLAAFAPKKDAAAATKLADEATVRLEELASAIDELRLEEGEEYESLLDDEDEDEADEDEPTEAASLIAKE